MSSPPDPDQISPPRGLDRLLALQELDSAVDRLTARHEVLESQEEIRVARDRVAQADARLGELRLAIDEVAGRQRRLEGDVDSLERKIEAERTRLYDGSVANAKELQALEHEVQSLQNRKSRMEDDLLEEMERREELEARVGALEGEAEEAQRRLAEVEETVGKELVKVERALEERRDGRASLTAQVDEELLELYEDIRRQRRGVGAAALVDGICQGCHQKLSPRYLSQLRRSTDVWRCEYCRRILVPE